jgi:hypothetical protein
MAGNTFLTSLVFIALLLLIINVFDFDYIGEKIAGVILFLLALSITSAVVSLIAVIWQ